ncbi:class I SAM-dependent methyltransferase [Arthrobacter sp. ISL-72]|uniref:class I SAM-dependent methyltransferase n=1 Tax=Arthrobacter sp. ISL-72 TaxID=2819114 RepID=UPI001BE9D400|nr:class I SAM-dependent methyltransferase [Arthrobacter sp. ISL-72]MBT2597908.1 class I SAM-dependent methyltransferase [Arthrobacter sp. ISL-72]
MAEIEIGVSSGMNLPPYGPGVEHVTEFDLSEKMLAITRRRVAEKGIDRVELHHGGARTFDLPSESADIFLSTFTFCTVPGLLAASREACRVLRPGGVFVLAEHGRSTRTRGRAVMCAIEPLSIRVSADHIARDPVPYLMSAGFTITEDTCPQARHLWRPLRVDQL